MKNFLNKIITILRSLNKESYPPLNPNESEQLKRDKRYLDEDIQLLDSNIVLNFSPDYFYIEPNKEFYKKTAQQKMSILSARFGLSSITYNINFRIIGEGGVFIRKPIPVIDTDKKTISWEGGNHLLEINISKEFEDDPVILSAILSHELAHFYIYKNNLMRFYNTKTVEEVICEIIIFLLGLGKLYLNGISDEKLLRNYGATKIISINPYLPWHHLAYIYEKVNFIKRISNKIARENLNSIALVRILRVSQHQELIIN